MRCPLCKNQSKLQSRIHRRSVFKIIPYSKNYKCYNCESEYLSLWKFAIPYRIKQNITILK